MKPQAAMSLEEAFSLVNYSDRTDHEPELTKNPAFFFYCNKISLYTVEKINSLLMHF